MTMDMATGTLLFCWSILALAVIFPTSSSYTSGQFPPGPMVATCGADLFAPRCQGNGELVVMEAAMYGRMRLGECAKDDLGYIGCGADVLREMDRRCSGRRECDITIPDGELDELAINAPVKCSRDVTSYLNASYSCHKALNIDKSKCKSSVTISVIDSVQIASAHARETGCGLQGTAPYYLQAQPGQRLNISLLDFRWQHNDKIYRAHPHCKKYGRVLDIEAGMISKDICAFQNRQRHLLVTSGHTVQIGLHGDQIQDNDFILRVTVEGCPDLNVPRDAWMKRDGNQMVVGCNHTRQEWHLSCEDTRWTGVIGNCSRYIATAKLRQESDGGLSVSHGAAILVICAVAMLISCLVIVGGVICLKQNAEQEKKYHQALKNDYLKVHKYQNNEIPDLYQSYHSSHMRPQSNAFQQPGKLPNEQHYSLGSADSSLYNTVHTETTGYSKPEVMPHEIMTSPVTTPGAPKTETEALQAQRKFFVMDKKMGHGIGVV